MIIDSPSDSGKPTVPAEESKKFRILHLEDNPQDGEYIETLLHTSSQFYEVSRVESREQFLEKLAAQPPPDIIISDYTLPSFDGLSALKLSREKASNIPFLFVSGSMGEEFAVECLRQGAKDYLLKGKLVRLVPAVRRALEDAEAEKERLRIQHQLFYNAFHDGLTGLSNRPYFLQQLQESLNKPDEESESPIVVAVVGLNEFHSLCDGFGWEANDSLLRTVAEFIGQQIPTAKLLSRISEDEFGLLFEESTDSLDLLAALDILLKSFDRPIQWNGQAIYVSASIGIVCATPDYRSSELMLRDCENALHHAKTLEKSGLVLYDPAMHQQAVHLVESNNALRRAVERMEFCVHYQPIMELATGGVSGFEALVRWQDPRRGLVFPLDFISAAERIHLIGAIGDFVLRESCQALKRWRAAFRDYPNLSVSVNVSQQQFDADFFHKVCMALEEASLDPLSLKLEVTESGIMHNPESTIELMKQLKNFGIGLEIDDFGTGYSSLSHLDRFPMEALKIDRSFVERIHEGGENNSIPVVIIDLAHNLKLHVIAEGIETPEQAAFLKEKGCEFGQGYLYSKPMPEEKVLLFLANHLQLKNLESTNSTPSA